jgi:hypothetical protein
MIVERYSPDKAEEWNQFVKSASNATFMALRPYVEYHADRFEDHSLLIYDDQKKKLHAVLPANARSTTLYSHQGLTYGGFITANAYTFQLLEAFNAVNAYCQEQGLETLVYKPLPHIYADYPAQNDLYCLFRLNARLLSRGLSATVPTAKKLKFSGSRLQGVKRAEKGGLLVEKAESFDEFWAVLEYNLQQKYGTSATHSLAEITCLHQQFPADIELYVVRQEGQVVAGAVIYLTSRVAHAQYISASSEGQVSGALDFLFHRLINEVYVGKEFFDFGTSNEDSGRILNTNLIFQKEGFGGRGVVYDVYEYDTNQVIS